MAKLRKRNIKNNMRIALIHDYIIAYGGAEKTFKTLIEIFPDAEVYTLFYDSKIKNKFFSKIKIKTSFIQKFPTILRRRYQLLLPFLPIAAETLDFRDFDLVISSSFSFTKGIITRPKTKHICYCYSPTRYLWDYYLNKKPGNFLARLLVHYIRIWDRQASERVDNFVAISGTVQKRIKKYYKRDSIIIYPPVQFLISNFEFPNKSKTQNPKHEYYLIVSQLRKYKRIDLAVEAFNKLGLKLIIIGDGPEKSKLQKKAKKNIKFLGWQPDEVVEKFYKNCSAFIFPSEDDFGIAPVEAMSYGKPVLAYKKGGAVETIIEGQTGEFFDWPDVAVLADGVRRLRQNFTKYDSRFIAEHARIFSKDRFKKEFKRQINKILDLK